MREGHVARVSWRATTFSKDCGAERVNVVRRVLGYQEVETHRNCKL